MRLTTKSKAILRRISEVGQTPTEIGQQLGQPYYKASSWACSTLKPLLVKGLVSQSGPYYSITEAGREALKEHPQ